MWHLKVLCFLLTVILPPVGYHRVKGDGEGEGEGKDVEELYVKEKRGEGERKPMATILHKRKALHGHTVTKVHTSFPG